MSCRTVLVLQAVTCILCLFSLAGPVAAQEEVIVYPRVRLDPDTGDDRAALEFSATARGLEVVVLWMKRPPIEANKGPDTIGRAYSSDAGVTWTVTDFHTPDESGNDSELDPMTAYDPRTGMLFIGGLRASNNFFVARRGLGDSTFSTGVIVRPNNYGGGFEKPWMAAGPKRGFPNTTRIYIAGPIGGVDPPADLLWSDDLGLTWSTPFEAGSKGQVSARGQGWRTVHRDG